MDLVADLRASNEAGIVFLKTELSLAHTFLDVAKATHEREHRLQSEEDARKAYQGVLQFIPRLRLSRKQKRDFDRKLAALKKRLMLARSEL